MRGLASQRSNGMFPEHNATFMACLRAAVHLDKSDYGQNQKCSEEPLVGFHLFYRCHVKIVIAPAWSQSSQGSIQPDLGENKKYDQTGGFTEKHQGKKCALRAHGACGKPQNEADMRWGCLKVVVVLLGESWGWKHAEETGCRSSTKTGTGCAKELVVPLGELRGRKHTKKRGSGAGAEVRGENGGQAQCQNACWERARPSGRPKIGEETGWKWAQTLAVRLSELHLRERTGKGGGDPEPNCINSDFEMRRTLFTWLGNGRDPRPRGGASEVAKGEGITGRPLASHAILAPGEVQVKNAQNGKSRPASAARLEQCRRSDGEDLVENRPMYHSSSMGWFITNLYGTMQESFDSFKDEIVEGIFPTAQKADASTALIAKLEAAVAKLEQELFTARKNVERLQTDVSTHTHHLSHRCRLAICRLFRVHS
ncbi:hypothetical protein B0H19DRAFT_1055138 [Mycena capillaripes]|nr:hypothetical protein B0H19DRAFT_1055138 [Mycena capillaripes]